MGVKMDFVVRGARAGAFSIFSASTERPGDGFRCSDAVRGDVFHLVFHLVAGVGVGSGADRAGSSRSAHGVSS
ncbi:hypothetical protein MICRO8M_20079 [Microbacterium sp. 8M]|nr:hypothetical protein MICRO8M_20079 [Microbacterium sp. 8M]